MKFFWTVSTHPHTTLEMEVNNQLCLAYYWVEETMPRTEFNMGAVMYISEEVWQEQRVGMRGRQNGCLFVIKLERVIVNHTPVYAVEVVGIGLSELFSCTGTNTMTEM